MNSINRRSFLIKSVVGTAGLTPGIQMLNCTSSGNNSSGSYPASLKLRRIILFSASKHFLNFSEKKIKKAVRTSHDRQELYFLLSETFQPLLFFPPKLYASTERSVIHCIWLPTDLPGRLSAQGGSYEWCD